MNFKSKNNIKVTFCTKCVMSNQKVLPSVVTDDNIEHSNKANIPFENGICNACTEVEKKYKETSKNFNEPSYCSTIRHIVTTCNSTICI